MKANFQKLSSRSTEYSFADFWVRDKAFGFHWHYHPELELCYVKRGRGKRIIGSSIEDFDHGDLVLVGSNVPHSWITDESFNRSEEDIEVFVIQFAPEVFDRFLGMPEMSRIGKMLRESAKGLFFDGISISAFESCVENLESASGSLKLARLIELLDMLSKYKPVKELHPSEYTIAHKKHQEDRILKVCNYIHAHYKNRISIEELADLIGMNSASFCRFFKKTLGKTALDYINELRISYVCTQIQNSREPVYRIAYDTGFSSIAHFNKQFRRRTGHTPTEYRALVS